MEDRQRSYTKRSSTGIWFLNVSFGNLAKLLCPSTPLDPFIVSHTLNTLDRHARTKLCTSNCLTISSAWHSTLQPNPLSMFIARPKYWIFHSNNVAFTSIVRTGQNAAMGSSNTEENDIIFELSISEIAVKSFWMSIILKKLQTAVSYLTVSQFPISCTYS